jgi:hypothetical protein
VTPRHAAVNWARRLTILSHLQGIAPGQYGSDLPAGR